MVIPFFSFHSGTKFHIKQTYGMFCGLLGNPITKNVSHVVQSKHHTALFSIVWYVSRFLNILRVLEYVFVNMVNKIGSIIKEFD